MSGRSFSLAFTPLLSRVFLQQRQDKAALVNETRRRFEAEYLPGKHFGRGGGGRGGMGALWLWSQGLSRCRCFSLVCFLCPTFPQ